jgi:hypothetical protein
LYAARELPANAPEWAIKARDAGDLMYFQPDDILTDRIDNVSHYLASLESDAASNDPQKKADARKELQGFPKAETLDIIIKAATEYFAKGTKKMHKGDVSGMLMILDLPSGFAWYQLKEQDAFVREGKVLQNCIGRHYTQQSAERDGLQIYILKDPNGESVVGVRASGRDLIEVKGKQNKPPVSKYMPPVQHLVNHFKFIPTSGGMSDLTNTGYFYHEGVLYSRPQAVKKLLQVTAVGTTESGISVDSVSSNVDRFVRLIYKSAFTLNNPVNWGKSDIIYIGHVSDKLDITILVVDGFVQHILNGAPDQQGITEDADVPMDNIDPTFQILKLLADKKRITGLSDDAAKLLQWQHHIGFDKNTQKFIKYNPGKLESTGADTHKYHTYTGAEARAMANALTSKNYTKSVRAPQDVDKIYTSKIRTDSDGQDVTLVAAVTKQGKLLPYVVTGGTVYTHGASGAARIPTSNDLYNTSYVPDEKTLKTLVDLANAKKLTLPHNFQIKHGLTKDGDSYKKIDIPEKPLTDFPGKMWDISDFNDYDKVAALYQISSQFGVKLGRWSSQVAGDRLGIRSSWSRYLTRSYHVDLSDVDDDDDDDHLHNNGDMYKNGVHRRERPSEWLTWEFDGEIPTAIYAFDIKYGTDKSHPVVAFVSNNTIIRLDGLTVSQNWQSWDDYEFVATQLNDFANARGLKYSPNAIKRHAGSVGTNSTEFAIIDNQVSTQQKAASNKLNKTLSKRKGGAASTAEMKFADGTTLTRMDPDAFGNWSRKVVKKNVVGEPWVLNKDGKDSAIIIVRSNKVVDMYTNGKNVATTISEIDSSNTKISEYLPYVRGASEKLGLTNGNKKLIIGRDSTAADILKYIKKHDGAPVKDTVLRRSPDIGSHIFTAINRLRDIGLVRLVHMDRSAVTSKSITDGVVITANGLAVADALMTTHDDVNVLDVIQSAEVDKDFKIPEPAVTNRVVKTSDDNKPPTTRTRTPMEGGGSKADQALALFTQMAANNGGTIPGRSEFITKLMAPPFNMTKAGASTYQYNIKAKYLKQQGTIPEGVTFKQFLTLMG